MRRENIKQGLFMKPSQEGYRVHASRPPLLYVFIAVAPVSASVIRCVGISSFGARE